MKVLVASADGENANFLIQTLLTLGHEVLSCKTGKDCQLLLYKTSFNLLVIDSNIQDHSLSEVMRYLKAHPMDLRCVLSVEAAQIAQSQEDLVLNKILGFADYVVRPYTQESILKNVLAEHFSKWRYYQGTVSTHSYEEEEVLNEAFSPVSLTEFIPGSVNPVDFYMQLSPVKFLKILRAGDFFDQGRLDNFIQEKKITSLHIKKADLGVYLNFMNAQVSGGAIAQKMSTKDKVRVVGSLAGQYLEEAYTYGLPTDLVNEGISLCDSVCQIIQNESEILTLMEEYQEENPSEFQRLFKVSFFAILIGKKLDWVTPRTIQYLAMGGLLHDIGIMKLPLGLRRLSECRTRNEIQRHMQHAHLGATLLESTCAIPNAVIQITLQHHEKSDGSGHPHGLKSSKIFPLAKIVSLASDFYGKMVERKESPIQCLQTFVPYNCHSLTHDPDLVKALLLTFIRSKDPLKKSA